MVLRSMALMTGLNVAKAAAAVLISMMIAGHVPPEEFGLVAFAIPLMTFITLLTDLGLSGAIVRHPELDRHGAGSAIGLMGVAGLIGGGLLALLAAPAERLLALHGLTPVLIGFGIVTACSIWATGPRALLERQLAYQKVVAVESSGLALALLVFFIGLALHAGVMAMVAFHVVLQAVRAAVFTWLARSAFELSLDARSVAPLIRVGSWVLGANLLSYAGRNVDRMMIGPVLGAAALGLYGLGYQFMILPLVLISWPASGVLLSTLSRMDKDPSAQSGVVSAMLMATATVSIPMMVFFVFGLRFPVEHFYPSKWSGLPAIVAALAPVGALQSLAAYNGAVLVQRGRVRLNFMMSVLNGVVISGVFIATVWFGLSAMIAAYVVASVFVCGVMIYYMCREVQIGKMQFARCLLPGTVAAVVGTLAVAALTGFRPASLAAWLLQLSVYSLAVLAAYFCLRGRLLMSLRLLGQARVQVQATA